MTYVKNLEDKIEYLQSRCAQLEFREEFRVANGPYAELKKLSEEGDFKDVTERCLNMLGFSVVQTDFITGYQGSSRETYTICRHIRPDLSWYSEEFPSLSFSKGIK